MFTQSNAIPTFAFVALVVGWLWMAREVRREQIRRRVEAIVRFTTAIDEMNRVIGERLTPALTRAANAMRLWNETYRGVHGARR